MGERSQEAATPARHRNRATRACTQCRKARVRCVVDSESRTCIPCRSSDLRCVFDDKDGRKCRASVKTVEATLMERIRVLETQLEEERAKARSSIGDTPGSSSRHLPDQVFGKSISHDGLSPGTASSRSVPLTGKEDQQPVEDQRLDFDEPASSVVTKLMPSSIRFDMASGRVRYFGSTTHMNVLTKVSSSKITTRRQGAHWPIALVLKDLSPITHDYLMGLFWEYYNSVIRLVDREAYYHDQESGGVEYYSTFLHLSMLATGFRYAEKARPDIQRLALSENVTSTIHEKTKALGKLEIERPGGGIPSIQALQLLSGLEFCCGNDDTGWMFSGMCFRMVYDAGLHIDHISLGISKSDTQVRHMVLWACLTADRLWSLYLGRPTTLKTSDISPNCLSYMFDPPVSSDLATPQKDLVTRIYEAMLQMMERVGKLCDLRGPRPAKSTDSCLQIAAIGQQLRDWYHELPPDLVWTNDSRTDVPLSYYLLHTQYHAALILLHRPIIQYNETVEDGLDVHFKGICRKSCASSAESIAIILEKYRARFELSQVFGTAVQHAGTAATAMMGEIFIQADPVERMRFIERLSSLRIAVSLMSRNYHGAGLMANVIDQFIRSMTNRSSMDSRDKIAVPVHYAARQGQMQGRAPLPIVGQMGQVVMAQGSAAMMASPPPQRWRLDPWASFDPSPAGHSSPAGLPHLPLSVLEGIMEDFNYEDMSGGYDPSAWEHPSLNDYQ